MSAKTDALAKMVSPNMHRPVMLGGVCQLFLGKQCCEQCAHCTQNSQLRGNPHLMNPEQFEIACKSMVGYTGVLGLFGGNPTMSPYFDAICEIFCRYFPKEQRGIWTNHPHGKGAICRKVFDPSASNLNCHLNMEAYREFCRDWPESKRFLKGQDCDSRHAPIYVAMKDVVADEDERWRLVADCELNRFWSAMVCVTRGQVRGFFCEIAAAMSMLHEDDNEEEWPTLGLPATPGWWNQSMSAFEAQASHYCHRCSAPLKGKGVLAMSGGPEQVSETHRAAYKPKDKNRLVELVTDRSQLQGRSDRMTTYLPTESQYAP